jgi:hypothetical protein
MAEWIWEHWQWSVVHDAYGAGTAHIIEIIEDEVYGLYDNIIIEYHGNIYNLV